MIKTLLMSLALTLLSSLAWALDVKTPMGRLTTSDGRVLMDDKVLVETRDASGASLPVVHHTVFFVGREREHFYAFTYGTWDGELYRRNLFFVDIPGDRVTVSNAVTLPSDYRWPDNNYVIAKGDKVYFGFYEPQRIQFVYEAGRITPNPGKWMGPRKVIENFPMKSSDPCFNVSGVEECREEIERARQRKLANTGKSKANTQ